MGGGERSISEVSEKNFSLLLPDLVERSSLLMQMYRETTVVKAVVLKTWQEDQDPEKVWKTLLPFYPLNSDYPNSPCRLLWNTLGC